MRPLPSADLAEIVEHLGDELRFLRDSRVLVTGATGFVGSWIVESLGHANRQLALGCDIFALVLPSELDGDAARFLTGLDGVRLVAGDIRQLDHEAMAKGIGRLDAVVHAALHVDASSIARDPIPTLDTAVEGTRRVLEVARAARARRVLFVSSGAVYGPQPSAIDRLPEEHLGGPPPFTADSVYSEGKRIGETICACFGRAYAIETVVARCFAFVGPRLPLDRQFAIGNFVGDALAGRAIVVKGDGTAVRSYMYAAELVEWLLVLLCRGTAGRAYNVGSPHAMALARVAELIAGSGSRRLPVEVREVAVPGAAAHRYVPSVERAERELGLQLRVPLLEAIERTLAWHRGAQ